MWENKVSHREEQVRKLRQNFLAPPGMPGTCPEGTAVRFHSVLVTAVAVLAPEGSSGRALAVQREQACLAKTRDSQ